MQYESGIEFDVQGMYDLLVHYTDGECPLSGEVKMIAQHPQLGMMIGIVVESPEWTEAKPLHLRYDGKRIASWVQGEEQMQFEQRNDTPNLQ